MKRSIKLLVAAAPLAALVGMVPRLVPAAAVTQGTIGTITLNQCEVDLRPSQVMGKQEVDAYFQESAGGVVFTLFPEKDVAIAAANQLGLDPRSLESSDANPANNRNILTVTYVAGSPPSMTLGVDIDADGTADKSYNLRAADGSMYNPFGELKKPELEDAGFVPGTTDKRRLRVNVDYYGVRSFFTLIDV